MSGLGLRSAVLHSPASYLSSLVVSVPVYEDLIPSPATSQDLVPVSTLLTSPNFLNALALHNSYVQDPVLPESVPGFPQKQLSHSVDSMSLSQLVVSVNGDRDLARIQSLCLPGGRWLAQCGPSEGSRPSPQGRRISDLHPVSTGTLFSTTLVHAWLVEGTVMSSVTTLLVVGPKENGSPGTMSSGTPSTRPPSRPFCTLHGRRGSWSPSRAGRTRGRVTLWSRLGLQAGMQGDEDMTDQSERKLILFVKSLMISTVFLKLKVKSPDTTVTPGPEMEWEQFTGERPDWLRTTSVKRGTLTSSTVQLRLSHPLVLTVSHIPEWLVKSSTVSCSTGLCEAGVRCQVQDGREGEPGGVCQSYSLINSGAAAGQTAPRPTASPEWRCCGCGQKVRQSSAAGGHGLQGEASTGSVSQTGS